MSPIPIHHPTTARSLAAALLAATASCATVSPSVAQPGYECSFKRQGVFGTLSADFELPLKGQASIPPFLRWETDYGPGLAPRISAAFYRMEDGRYRTDNGYASIGWHVWDPGRRPLTLSLQLRTRPEVPKYARAVLASEFEQSGGPFHLNVEWSEVAAFARGARELHLLALDRTGKLVASAPIDPAIFTRAEAPIVEAMRELEGIVANPAPTCRYLDDLESNDIVVTSGQ
jgi:hypothetical protein